MSVFRRVLVGLAFLAGLSTTIVADLIRGAAQSDAIAQGDVALILGAAVWGDQPSPVFQARIDHAVDLYRAGHVRQLVFTGGTASDTVAAESHVARRYAVALGTPAEDVYVEAQSETTAQNLACSLPLLHRLEAERVVVVSDPLHLWRARWMARDLELTVELAPTPRSRYRSRSARARFLLREVVFSFVYAIERMGGPPRC